MKHWWRNVVKDYFTFSKRERNAVIVLLLLIAVALLVWRYYPVNKPEVSKEAFQKELADLKITVDSSRNSNYHNFDNNDDYLQPKPFDNYHKREGELFVFDPNTLDEEGWKRLGLRDKTAQTIQHFLAKGYKFRQPEDLRRIYGLRPEDADRLIPYVRIAGREAPVPVSASPSEARPVAPRPEFKPRTIEINAADTSALISLPGIGSKLANRIINFRQKLGGFYSVDQLTDTYGLPDSTFQKIKARLICNDAAVKTININSADINELRSHPYIKWNIANVILNYRTQHGNYKSVDDIRKIDIITDDLFRKIAPYLRVQ